MLSVVVSIPTVFGLAIWSSYRRGRADGGDFAPAGKLRWDAREPVE